MNNTKFTIMNLKLLFILATFLATSTAFGQIQVTGKVLDSMGETLPGATVAFSNENGSQGGITDAMEISLFH